MGFHDTCSKLTRPYLIGSKSQAAHALREYHAWAKSEGVTVLKYWTEFVGRQGDTYRHPSRPPLPTPQK